MNVQVCAHSWPAEIVSVGALAVATSRQVVFEIGRVILA